MALPKLTTPTYELEVPSTDEKIKYRPFLVKEEKILLIALESGENKDIVQAVKTIVDECTFNKLKLGKMPMFDVEYIFLQIRSKSVGEVSKLKVLCKDDGETYANVEVDLNEFEIFIKIFNNGNIIILAFLGIIINMGQESPIIGYAVSLGSVPMAVAVNMLEIFVAFLQAYVFSLLSSIFIGMAVAEHEHH